MCTRALSRSETNHQDHPVLLQQTQLEDLLDIRTIRRFIGVDKHQIEPLVALLLELGEGLEGGSDAEIDFGGNAGAGPVRSVERFEEGLDVEGDNLCNRGKEGEGELGGRNCQECSTASIGSFEASRQLE